MLGNVMGQAETMLSASKSGGEASGHVSAAAQGQGQFGGGWASVAGSASVDMHSSGQAAGADNSDGGQSGVHS